MDNSIAIILTIYVSVVGIIATYFCLSTESRIIDKTNEANAALTKAVVEIREELDELKQSSVVLSNDDWNYTVSTLNRLLKLYHKRN